MVGKILMFFGYVKIPLAAVQLSIMQEQALITMIAAFQKCGVESETLPEYLKAQKTLTAFLRSGRLLQ